MKTFRLLIAATLIAQAASAQSYSAPAGSETSTVYLIAAYQDAPSSSQEEDCTPKGGRAMANKAAVEAAIADHEATMRTGYQALQQPLLIIAQRENKFSFAVGGYISMRAGYDLDGSVSNIDFVTADIPVPGTYASNQKLMMDVTTSRVFAKGIINTSALGQVELFVDADYRGGTAGNYQPRVRSGYVSFLGFTVGRDVTTFCDLDAAVATIDFEGPNAYNDNFATMVRYQCNLANDHLSMGVAAEYPKFWGTYGANFTSLPQRVPDIPFYLQYEWGYARQNHFRASGVIRNPYMYNKLTEQSTSLTGWGVQASGSLQGTTWICLKYSGVYGSAISQYIQDFTGMGIDFTPEPDNASKLQTTPMWGFQIGSEFMLSERTAMNAGYSTAAIDNKNGYYSDDEYLRGEYIFGNLFYHVTPRFKMGGEYLYGRRKNVNNERNHANRINLLAQFSF
ncbi:MAG: DcaP family trimeric outer membrane transporter [Rikenellaceae bacterium]